MKILACIPDTTSYTDYACNSPSCFASKSYSTPLSQLLRPRSSKKRETKPEFTVSSNPMTERKGSSCNPYSTLKHYYNILNIQIIDSGDNLRSSMYSLGCTQCPNLFNIALSDHLYSIILHQGIIASQTSTLEITLTICNLNKNCLSLGL